MPGAFHAYRLSFEQDLAGIDVVGAEDGPSDLRAAASHEPREPDDLARLNDW